MIPAAHGRIECKDACVAQADSANRSGEGIRGSRLDAKGPHFRFAPNASVRIDRQSLLGRVAGGSCTPRLSQNPA
jgi:hypothetical protein